MTTDLKRIVLRRGTTAEWTAANPVLASGEPGIDTTTGTMSIGDGVSNFLDLPTTADEALAAAAAALTFSINEQTDDYTLALADASNAVAMNKATANTLTIPTNATVAFQIGTQILVYQSGVGATSISAPGVTLRPSAAPAFVAQWASAMLIKIGADEWLIQGGVT